MDQELTHRGEGIVAELGVGGTTERWVAHYVAELMERAETAASTAERAEASAECVSLIRWLWDRAQFRGQSHVASASDRLGGRPASDSGRQGTIERHLHRLRDGHAPSRLAQTDERDLLHELHDMEHAVLVLLSIAGRAEGVMQWYVAWKGLGFAPDFPTLVNVFPEVKSIDLEKPRKASAALRQVVRDLCAMRLALLGG